MEYLKSAEELIDYIKSEKVKNNLNPHTVKFQLQERNVTFPVISLSRKLLKFNKFVIKKYNTFKI